ncbi:MAG: nitroreductase family protein [Streptococcaceae bacterium]|nr:nitroreductase family protein [Streptococcaceae bacterium]
MDFVKLNKTRHAVKHFDGTKIPTVDVKQIISAAALAPSAHDIQSWHFVILESEEKRKALLEVVKGQNIKQIEEAGAVVMLFSDTDLASLSKEIAAEAGDELPEEMLNRFNERYPQMFAGYDAEYTSRYLSLNAGLVALNFMYAVYNHGLYGNFIQGFERTDRVNEILEVDKRYRPELILTLGNSEFHGAASYRLPQDKIFEIK